MLIKIRTAGAVPLLLFWMALFPSVATASIKIVDSGRTIPSRPDRQLGQKLWKGYEYMGRLQFLHGNLQLCPSPDDPHRRFSITVPSDGLPVALYAKAGGCTLEEKAMVASTMIDPPNTVGYIIVEDARTHEKDSIFLAEAIDYETAGEELLESDERQKESDASPKDDLLFPVRLENFSVKGKDSSWWDLASFDDVDENEEKHRILKHGDNIAVAILHVTNRAGYELLDLMLKESADVRTMGGPKVLLNSKLPNASAKTIVLWVFFSFTIGSICCCCALFCAGTLAEEETNTPRQPVRRRLTHNQVREKFPAFLYSPHHHVEQPLDDECAICLDDFTEGMRLRTLPCGHTFHSSCIARWMIERSAVCPLCKTDFYEEEVEDSESEASAEAAEPNSMESLLAWLTDRSGPELTPRGAQPGANTANSNNTTNLGSSQFPWWRWRQSTPTGAANVAGNEGATPSPTPPTPPPARAFRWMFGRQRRRGTESGMLTELTEPLISAGTNDGIPDAIEASTNETGSEDPEAGPGEEAATSPEEAQVDAGAQSGNNIVEG